MSKRSNLLSVFQKSSKSLSNRMKYSIIQKSCAVIHLLLVAIFAFLGVWPMVIFNIVSTTCYMASAMLVKKGKYLLFYYITFAEICLHSYVAAILVGWESGFPLYIVGITPVIFYMHFSLNESAGLGEASMIGISAMLIYIVCKLITLNSEPFYILTPLQTIVLHLFNTVCMFLIILFFSILFLRDISTSKAIIDEQNQRLDKLAGIDALTGLYNRKSMDKFIQSARISKKTFSFIMCDIDDFKDLNRIYGNDSGDVVLRCVSDIIVSNLRGNDHVCRWGDNMILILANNTSIEIAASISERIRQQIEAMEMEAADGVIKCTITAGISDSTEACSPDDIIATAEKRLEKGKESGKNCVVIC